MPKPVILPQAQVERIEQILDELRSKTRASYVFLADISGQLIQARGITGATDLTTLAALTASNMAATAEMARQIGENQPFRLMFHEGSRRNIYLSQVGTSFLLAVVFDAEVQIGLVRLFSKRATEELLALADEYEAIVRQTPSMMEAGFDVALDQALDSLLPPSSKTPGDQIIIR
ncbi:MAG: roadblock/LC7 domain-containing protein [Anaerolineae bacterium]|nr:roadblock/LC7 domain-containing protein [Anaerolineae bacterium]